MKAQFEKFMQQCPAVAILRGLTTPEVPAVCDALYAAGITLLEIPLNSPDPFNSIAAAVKHCGDRQMVGAGTVLTPEDVQRVHAAGGKSYEDFRYGNNQRAVGRGDGRSDHGVGIHHRADAVQGGLNDVVQFILAHVSTSLLYFRRTRRFFFHKPNEEYDARAEQIDQT